MKVYIAGPMTGYVNHNFDAFRRAADHLRRKGFEVVNPAELDGDTPHAELRKIPHHVFMRRDIRLLVDCDLIYLLPGWVHSKGASLEAQVAVGVGIDRLEDADVDLWRTFEGEPEIDHSACDEVEGDGQGNAWCAHGVQTEESPVAEPEDEGPAPVDAEDLSDHPQWGSVFADIDYAVDDSLPPNTLRLVTGNGSVDFDVAWVHGEMHLERKSPQALERWFDLRPDRPQPGDEFPNVGYVRRFLSLMNEAHNSGERRSA